MTRADDFLKCWAGPPGLRGACANLLRMRPQAWVPPRTLEPTRARCVWHRTSRRSQGRGHQPRRGGGPCESRSGVRVRSFPSYLSGPSPEITSMSQLALGVNRGFDLELRWTRIILIWFVTSTNKSAGAIFSVMIMSGLTLTVGPATRVIVYCKHRCGCTPTCLPSAILFLYDSFVVALCL